MPLPVHVTIVGVLLALAFGGTPVVLIVRMLRAAGARANATEPARSAGRVRVLLVPVTGDSESRRRVELACEFADEQCAMVLLVYVIEVPWTLPLDATFERADREATAALEEAREEVEKRCLPVRTAIRRARIARDGIAEAARDHQTDLVFRVPASEKEQRHPSRSSAARK